MKKLILILVVFAFSCQSGKKTEIKVLKEEVIKLHDTVMPQMNELRYVRKDLMLQTDSVLATDSAQAAVLTTTADGIRVANESMMQWMRNFQPDFEGTEDEILQYFNQQKEAIQNVKDTMDRALARGKKILEQD